MSRLFELNFRFVYRRTVITYLNFRLKLLKMALHFGGRGPFRYTRPGRVTFLCFVLFCYLLYWCIWITWHRAMSIGCYASNSLFKHKGMKTHSSFPWLQLYSTHRQWIVLQFVAGYFELIWILLNAPENYLHIIWRGFRCNNEHGCSFFVTRLNNQRFCEATGVFGLSPLSQVSTTNGSAWSHWSNLHSWLTFQHKYWTRGREECVQATGTFQH
jgi:hypothetical protein